VEANLSGEAMTTMKMVVAMVRERERVLSQTFLAHLVQQSLMSICRLKRESQPKPLKASSAILAEERSMEKALFALLAWV